MLRYAFSFPWEIAVMSCVAVCAMARPNFSSFFFCDAMWPELSFLWHPAGPAWQSHGIPKVLSIYPSVWLLMIHLPLVCATSRLNAALELKHSKQNFLFNVHPRCPIYIYYYMVEMNVTMWFNVQNYYMELYNLPCSSKRAALPQGKKNYLSPNFDEILFGMSVTKSQFYSTFVLITQSPIGLSSTGRQYARSFALKKVDPIASTHSLHFLGG